MTTRACHDSLHIARRAYGRIRPVGTAAVEAAKADGRWDRAYAGPATMEVPDDFSAALAKDPAATSFFEDLNKDGPLCCAMACADSFIAEPS